MKCLSGIAAAVLLFPVAITDFDANHSLTLPPHSVTAIVWGPPVPLGLAHQ